VNRRVACVCGTCTFVCKGLAQNATSMITDGKKRKYTTLTDNTCSSFKAIVVRLIIKCLHCSTLTVLCKCKSESVQWRRTWQRWLRNTHTHYRSLLCNLVAENRVFLIPQALLIYKYTVRQVMGFWVMAQCSLVINVSEEMLLPSSGFSFTPKTERTGWFWCYFMTLSASKSSNCEMIDQYWMKKIWKAKAT
jgi:hypothetical protein